MSSQEKKCDQLTVWIQEQNDIRDLILQTLKDGPRTVPQIADKSGLIKKDVFWQIIALMKYGEIEQGEQDGDYLTYRLNEQTIEVEPCQQ